MKKPDIQKDEEIMVLLRSLMSRYRRETILDFLGRNLPNPSTRVAAKQGYTNERY